MWGDGIRMRDREATSGKSSKVKVYYEDPKEIALKYGPPKVSIKKILEERAENTSYKDIQEEHDLSNKEIIGIKNAVMGDFIGSFKKDKGEQKMESTVKRPRMDKQFFEDAFAQGKSLEDISKEQGVVFRIVKATASRVGAIENMSKAAKEAKEPATSQDILLTHDILAPVIKGETLEIKPPEFSSEELKISGDTLKLGRIQEQEEQGTFVKVNKEGTGEQIWSIIDRLAGFLDKDGTYDLVLELVEK